MKPAIPFSRYEQGLEDYEEAVARVDKMKEQQQEDAFGGWSNILSLFSVLNSAWNKVSTEANNRENNPMPTNARADSRNARQLRSTEDETLKGISSLIHIFFIFLANVSNNSIDNTKFFKTENNSTEIAEGRYIKGDPLKGYYDFVITEGSYKFWAAFQVN